MSIEHLLISESITVLQAMTKLEETGRQILIVAPDLKLKGVVTDSDIRRHIIYGGNLNDTVDKVVNYKPKYLSIVQKNEATGYMIKNSISALSIAIIIMLGFFLYSKPFSPSQ